jgi:hypothetical protein
MEEEETGRNYSETTPHPELSFGTKCDAHTVTGYDSDSAEILVD